MAQKPSIRPADNPGNPLGKEYPSIEPRRPLPNESPRALLDIERLPYPNFALDFQENLSSEALLNHISAIGKKVLGIVTFKRGKVKDIERRQNTSNPAENFFACKVEETEFLSETYRFIIPESDISIQKFTNKAYVYLAISIFVQEAEVPTLDENGNIVFGESVRGANYRFYTASFVLSDEVLPERVNFDSAEYPKFIYHLYATIEYDTITSHTPKVRYHFDEVPQFDSASGQNLVSNEKKFSAIELLSRAIYQMNHSGVLCEPYNMVIKPNELLLRRGVNFILSGKNGVITRIVHNPPSNPGNEINEVQLQTVFPGEPLYTIPTAIPNESNPSQPFNVSNINYFVHVGYVKIDYTSYNRSYLPPSTPPQPNDPPSFEKGVFIDSTNIQVQNVLDFYREGHFKHAFILFIRVFAQTQSSSSTSNGFASDNRDQVIYYFGTKRFITNFITRQTSNRHLWINEKGIDSDSAEVTEAFTLLRRFNVSGRGGSIAFFKRNTDNNNAEITGTEIEDAQIYVLPNDFINNNFNPRTNFIFGKSVRLFFRHDYELFPNPENLLYATGYSVQKISPSYYFRKDIFKDFGVFHSGVLTVVPHLYYHAHSFNFSQSDWKIHLKTPIVVLSAGRFLMTTAADDNILETQQGSGQTNLDQATRNQIDMLRLKTTHINNVEINSPMQFSHFVGVGFREARTTIRAIGNRTENTNNDNEAIAAFEKTPYSPFYIERIFPGRYDKNNYLANINNENKFNNESSNLWLKSVLTNTRALSRITVAYVRPHQTGNLQILTGKKISQTFSFDFEPERIFPFNGNPESSNPAEQTQIQIRDLYRARDFMILFTRYRNYGANFRQLYFIKSNSIQHPDVFFTSNNDYLLSVRYSIRKIFNQVFFDFIIKITYTGNFDVFKFPVGILHPYYEPDIITQTSNQQGTISSTSVTFSNAVITRRINGVPVPLPYNARVKIEKINVRSLIGIVENSGENLPNEINGTLVSIEAPLNPNFVPSVSDFPVAKINSWSVDETGTKLTIQVQVERLPSGAVAVVQLVEIPQRRTQAIALKTRQDTSGNVVYEDIYPASDEEAAEFGFRNRFLLSQPLQNGINNVVFSDLTFYPYMPKAPEADYYDYHYDYLSFFGYLNSSDYGLDLKYAARVIRIDTNPPTVISTTTPKIQVEPRNLFSEKTVRYKHGGMRIIKDRTYPGQLRITLQSNITFELPETQDFDQYAIIHRPGSFEIFNQATYQDNTNRVTRLTEFYNNSVLPDYQNHKNFINQLNLGIHTVNFHNIPSNRIVTLSFSSVYHLPHENPATHRSGFFKRYPSSNPIVNFERHSILLYFLGKKTTENRITIFALIEAMALGYEYSPGVLLGSFFLLINRPVSTQFTNVFPQIPPGGVSPSPHVELQRVPFQNEDIITGSLTWYSSVLDRPDFAPYGTYQPDSNELRIQQLLNRDSALAQYFSSGMKFMNNYNNPLLLPPSLDEGYDNP